MPEEPDRYDLDEMMDRLKGRSGSESPDKGELVTRADGSQAIKVRKRKRRTHQPQRERQRRIRMLQLSALLVLVLLLILAAGFLTIYVNTAPFRKQLVQRVAAGTGAQSELQQFRMNPVGANAHGLDMEWPEGNVLESLSLRLLQADVSLFSVLSGSFSGDSLTAQTGKLQLRRPSEGEARRVESASKAGSAPHFEQCNITNLQVHVQSGQEGNFRLLETEATFKPAAEDQRALLRLNGGDLRAHEWPLLRLNRAYIEFDGELVDVIGASFMHPDDERGTAELVGEVRPYGSETASSLDFTAESFLLSGLIGNSLGKLVDGRIDTDPESGDSRLLLPFDGQNAMSLTTGFRASEDDPFVLANLPALFALSQILGDDWVSKPNFGDQARGRLRREGDLIVLSELEMGVENRMAVRGELRQKAGALSGRMQIGISPSTIQMAENRALDAMFGDLRDGYRWVAIEIAGSAAAPEDNFSRLYAKALEGLKGPGRRDPEPTGNEDAPGGGSFEELTRPR